MPVLISASLASALGDGVPNEIVYMPEGSHTITPWVDGKPKTITVHVPAAKGAAIAAVLQASLVEREKSNVRPWFDFEHKNGAASALPKSFRYEPGKGIMCAVEWTGAGRNAIEGKDFSYLSPTFLLGDDGSPSGLPSRGPLASLLNEPAFRDIPRIAASDAAHITENTETTPIMSKLIFAALAISAAADNAETEAVNAISALKLEAADAKQKLALVEAANAKLKAQVEAAAKLRADTLVKAAVADGRIAPKDEDKQTKFRDKIEAGDTFAEEILAQLPKQHAGLDTPIVRAADGKPLTTDVRIEAAQAKARAELGAHAGFSEVWARAAEIDPPAFEA